MWLNKTVRDLTEMDKLEAWLKENGYKYKRADQEARYDKCGELGRPERHQILVYKGRKVLWDAICHFGSYGCDLGLLEIMGDIVDRKKHRDQVEGYLTAEDVITRVKAYEEARR